MSSAFLLFVYCALILAVSVAGGLIPLVLRLTHKRLQLAISLVAGVMLGVGLLHMLPHALLEAPNRHEVIFACVLAGFLTMFFIERFFCFHHHDAPLANGEQGNGTCLSDAEANQPGHDHKHAQTGASGLSGRITQGAHKLSWVGASIGLTLHTIIAGMALAASVEAESRGDHVTAVAGFGTFLVIFLHKPFDAMTITTLMTVGAWKRPHTHLVNGVFALMVPVGVGLFHLGLSHAGEGMNLVAYALAFSAGTFLCVSMSDLLPELQFHTHDRVALSASLLLGLSIAGGVGLLESQNHSHEGHGHLAAAGENLDGHRGEHHGAGDHAGDHPMHEHETPEAHHDDNAEEAHDHAPAESRSHDRHDASQARTGSSAADPHEGEPAVGPAPEIPNAGRRS
jgi:zinc and cadmium transporter